jgi:hypothetical protein
MNATRGRAERSAEANARLTGATGLVLLVLSCAEAATVVLGVRSVLTLHVVIGLLLVPPLLVKVCSVSWRFLRYYRHDEAYRRKGPPVLALRMLGPVLLAATLALFISGITLLLAPAAFGGNLKHIHALSFYIWLILVVVHVIAHAGDLRRHGAKDWGRRARAAVPGAVVRQLAVLASLAAGLALALSLVAHVGTYQHHISPPRQTGSYPGAAGFRGSTAVTVRAAPMTSRPGCPGSPLTCLPGLIGEGERGQGVPAVPHDVVGGQALGGRLGEQRGQPGRPVLGPARARRAAASVPLHHRAGLTAEPQQAFLAEQVVALVHGVEVDAQVDRQLPGGGQAGTGRLPAAGDGLDDPVPDLLVDGYRVVGFDAEQHGSLGAEAGHDAPRTR